MKAKSLFLSLLTSVAILSLFQGCSGISVSQDYLPSANFNNLSTYAWKSDHQEKTGDVRIDSPLINERIRRAVDDQLAAKGYRKVSAPPADITVSYTYAIRSKIKSSPSGSSFGFGFGTYGSRGAIGINTSTDVTEYDEGMLVIDISDGSSGDLLWQGKGTSKVNNHSTPEKTTEHFNAVVTKIMKQFPPEPNH